MAERMFFPGKMKQGEMVEVGRFTRVYFDGENLVILRKGENPIRKRVSLTRGYIVHSGNFNTYVKDVCPPKGANCCVAWLCGAKKSVISHSEEEYEEKIGKYYEENDPTTISYEWDVCGTSYAFHWVKKEGKYERPTCVAAFVGKAITSDEVLSLVPEMLKAGFPEWYVQQILGGNFGIRKKAFGEAAQKS